MTYTVEPLSVKDYIWAVEVAGISMLTEELKRPELINRPQLYFLVDRMISDGTALIAKHGEQPVGTIGALLIPNTFNPEITTLAEVIWYVLPEHRHSRVGSLLLQTYLELANEIADEVTLSLLPTSRINEASLSRQGLNKEEIAFRKQIKEL